MTPANVWILTAEIVLATAAVVIYLGGALVQSAKPWRWIASAGLLLAAAALWQCGGAECALPVSGPIQPDAFACYARWLALALAAVLLLIASQPGAGACTPEQIGSLLFTVVGLMLVAVAGDLVLMFVGLELISIPTYILLYLGRRDAASQEAAAKYFFLSILASAMLLYGLSFLYGTAGSTHLETIRARLLAPDALPAGFYALTKVALVLVLAGLSFKVAAVPFHFYAPDVYQGTTHPNAALLSVVPKAAGLVALVRLVHVCMPRMDPDAWRVVLVLSVLSMTLGNLLALWQDNLRRLLAYSSIANAGYLLIGLAVGLAVPHSSGGWDGIGAMLFYLCVYAAATLGLFAALSHLGRRAQAIETVDELAGLARTRPLPAAALALFLFSLAGLPPLAGFWGKLLLVASALNVGPNAADAAHLWFVVLAVIGMINAAVAAFYYLRIVGVMYFRTPLATPRAEGGPGPWIATVVCAVLVLALGFYPGPLVQASNAANPLAEISEDAADAPSPK
jgi:NADH-quinone oxidoreductase subunit N